MSSDLSRLFGELLSVPLRNGLTRSKAVRGAGTKMVNMGELFAHPRIRDVPMDRVPLDGVERDRSLLEPGDLLFARQSLVLEGAGKCSIFVSDAEPVTFESHVIRARLNPELADPDFYFYFFGSPRGRACIASIVEQVAAAGIRGSDLAQLPVPAAPLARQREVARTLRALDEKIEVNNALIGTLESTSRAVFEKWFVDFDQVREGMARANGSLTSESATHSSARRAGNSRGDLPEGWRWGCLGDIAIERRGIRQPSEIPGDTPYIALKHMPRRSIALGDWALAEEATSAKTGFEAGNILFGKLRPYFHKVGVAPVDGVCSTDIVVLGPSDPDWYGFVLGVVSSERFVSSISAASTGTRMPRTSWREMCRYEIALPPVGLARTFNAFARAAVDMIAARCRENRSLAGAREQLQRQLMLSIGSGQS
jgi:hypothetical protein